MIGKEIEHETLSTEYPFKLIILGNGSKLVGTTEAYTAYLDSLSNLMVQVFGDDVWQWLDLSAIAEEKARGIGIISLNESGEVQGLVHARQESLINGPEGKNKWVTSVVAAYPSGEGIGGELFDELKAEVTAAGGKVLFVRTDPNRSEAIAFYKKHGGKEAGIVEGYYEYDEGRAPALWLRFDLGEKS